ncbi:MAG: type II toxin-antitoxin system PrlF family antitoxin [Acidiphilium sp.]|nr:type II toxin-antitoxin system PrlF family antitoxin [Acidiphilium sp.]MDD4937294.1 type II toxin-antitoxin system PrlF family antitoxin [Acidiphilium sp.]
MPVVEEICTITAKGQTTVPKAVRQALGVGYGGRIAFRVEDGSVTIRALISDDENADPALTPFLGLLATDLATRPSDAVRAVTLAQAGRLDALAAEIGQVDPDDPIEGEVTL